jgi:hypothetical protein
MVYHTVARAVSNAAGSAVDAYRSRVQAQRAEGRTASIELNILVTSGLAVVGLLADVAAMHVRAGALQRALDEATAAGDLHRAEALRGQVVELLQSEPASARLLATLADYLPAILADGPDRGANVIEGQIV